jgi:septum formation protein
MIKSHYDIILGSQSPRRKELLATLDIKFDTRVANIEEIYPDTTTNENVAAFLAELKLSHLQKSQASNELIICSDTTVLVDHQILNKPKDKSEAALMLGLLSGKTHNVITAVAMASKQKQVVFQDETLVTFKTLNEAEIHYYLENYKPYDKAGSYGVQEWIGNIAITKMEGSFYTVMGLPTHLIYQALKDW